MPWIRHDSHEATVIKNKQALGPESPLETDKDGFAKVEDEDAAELLAALDAHVTYHPARPDDDDFDAEGFVDRTPMEEVVEDLETGDYDEHLEAIKSAADRQGVLDTVTKRRE